MENKYKSVKSFRKDLPPDDAVKSVEEIQEYITTYTEYDENNNVICEITYNHEGIVEQKYEYKYNDKGKLAEEILYYENDEIADRKKYEYDGNGQITNELVYYQDETSDTIQYAYDAEMNLIEKTTVNYDGQTDEKEIFEYSQGKLILHAIFDGEQRKFYETKYKYNSDGKLTELEEWDSETNKKNKTVDTYDEKGNLIKQLRYVDDRLIAKMLFTVGEDNWVSEVVDEDASHRNTLNIIHDANGNVLEETEYNSNNKLNHKILRKYNDRNDVIESKVFVDTHTDNITQNYIIRYDYDYR